MALVLKRVYEPPSRQDGTRVLVERLWPRGLSKEHADLDEWLKDVAPSNELRKWFHAHRSQWNKFREKYLKELSQSPAKDALEQLYGLNKKGQLSLLFASKDEEHNNAVVLKELLEGHRKPPAGTGPAVAAVAKRARAAARPR